MWWLLVGDLVGLTRKRVVPPNNQSFGRSTTTTQTTQEQGEGKVNRKGKGEEEGDTGPSQPSESKEMGHVSATTQIICTSPNPATPLQPS